MKRINVEFGVSDELYDELVTMAGEMHTNVTELFGTLMQCGSDPIARERLALVRHIHQREKEGRK